MHNPTNTQTHFEEVETVRHPDGVVAVVTTHRLNGRVSFSLAREFDRDGKVQRTQFLGRRHIEAARALLNDLVERLETHEDRARARIRGA